MSSRIVGTVVRHYKSDNLNRFHWAEILKLLLEILIRNSVSFCLVCSHIVLTTYREKSDPGWRLDTQNCLSVSVLLAQFLLQVFFYFCQFVMLITSSEMSASSERSDKQIQPEFSHCPSLSCRPSGLGRARVEVSRLWTDRGVYFPRCDWQSPLRWLPLIICQITPVQSPVLPLLAVQI